MLAMNEPARITITRNNVLEYCICKHVPTEICIMQSSDIDRSFYKYINFPLEPL